MTTYYQPFIAVTNHSTVLTDAEVQDAIAAFQHAVAYHFRPAWGTGGHIAFMPAGSIMPKNAWVFAITDTSDMQGALAYHDVDGNDVPTASIFALTEKQYGASWTVSLTHELWEALIDQQLGACFQVSQTEVVGYEVCDPVEADGLGFEEKSASGRSILISAFVTPQWFVPGSPGPWAYPPAASAAVAGPLKLASGGYVSIGKATANGIAWTQNQMRGGELVPSDTNPYKDREESGEERDFRLRRVRPRGRDLPHSIT